MWHKATMREGRVGGGRNGATARVAFALVALHLLLCAALFDPKIHTGGDSATYMLLAESLLRAGDGYSTQIAPGPPEVHTKYPPGYPALLAPVVAAFGRNFVALKLLSVLLTAVSTALFVVYARGERTRASWLLLALAFAVCPGVIDYSRWMLSEAAFLVVTLLALWQLERDRPDARLGPAFWMALFASVATFYVRSIGALLLAAGSLAYLTRREWRKFMVHGVVGAGLTIPWILRSRVHSGTTSSYFEEFLLANIYSPEAGRLDAWGMAGRFATNAWVYSTRELPRALAGSDAIWATSLPVAIVAVVVALLALLGLVRALRRRRGAPEYYLTLSCASIFLFQTSVADVRYLVVLMPLVLLYAADGAEVAAKFAGAWRAWLEPRLPALVAGALAVLSLGTHAARIPGNLDMIAAYRAGDRYAGYHPAVASFFDAAEWVKENTPADASATVRKPRLFHALTGRRALIYPFSTDGRNVLESVRRTDYVIVDALYSTTRRYLIPALRQDEVSFEVIHATDYDPPSFVLRVGNAATPPAS